MTIVNGIARGTVLVQRRQDERVCAEENCYRAKALAERLSDTFELRCAVGMAVDEEGSPVQICGRINSERQQLRVMEELGVLINQVKSCAWLMLGQEWGSPGGSLMTVKKTALFGQSLQPIPRTFH